MLTTEIAARVDAAEERLREGNYDQTDEISEVVKSLNKGTKAPEFFSASLALRLVKVLRTLGKGPDDRGEINNLFFKQAQDVLVKAFAWFEESPTLLKEQGDLHYERRYFDKALSSFHKIKVPAAALPEQIYALERAGASLRELRNFTEAESRFKQAAELSGAPSLTCLLERGWLRFYRELYEEACADFAAAQLRPEATRELRHRAMAGQIAARQAADSLNPEAKQDRARVMIKSWMASASGPSKEEAVNILVGNDDILTELNLYPAALLNYELLLEEIDPENENAWCLKITGLSWLRRFREAEQAYHFAQNKFPNSLAVWKQMGHVHFRQKRFREAYAYFHGEALEDLANSTQKDAGFLDQLKEDVEATEFAIASMRKMRRLKGAQIEADRAIIHLGELADLLSERAVIDFTERKYDSAIEFFDRALEINEYDYFALQWRAAAYRRKPGSTGATPDFVKARTVLDEALKKLPGAAGLWEENAWLAFDQGDLISASQHFESSVKLDPYMIHRQFSRIEVLVRRNLWDDAQDVFQKLLKQFPDDPEIEEQLCWFYLRRGWLEHAQATFEAIDLHHPGNVLRINAEGGYQLEQRNYPAAAACFRQVIQAVDYEPQYHINLAWALLRQLKEPGELQGPAITAREILLDEARNSCRKALELDPYYAKAHGCLGVIAYKRIAFIDAEVYFQKSMELSSTEGSNVELASLYSQMGRYEEAAKTLQQAIDLNKNDARALVEWGNLYLMTEKNKEAIQACRAAVSAAPHKAETQRALAIALMRSEKYDEAEEVIRKALKLVPPSRHWQLYLLLSQVLVNRGDIENRERKKKSPELYDEALKYVNAARQNNPSPNADIFFHAGVVQYRREEYRSSRENFAECVRANRDRIDAERYGNIVQSLIDHERRVFKVNVLYGYVLAGFCLSLLIILWGFYFRGTTRTLMVAGSATAVSATRREPQDEFVVDKSLLTVMTPILLGLVVVGALLPNLNTLKLPGGFEAVISEPKAQETEISSGPRGEIGFGSSLAVVSPDPY